jgi:hypothetical protein
MDFGTVLIGVSVLAVVVAVLSYWGSGRIYSGLGRGDLELRREQAASPAEAQEEIRQMLEAKSRRREARGEAPLDVDAEVPGTSGGPPSDPAPERRSASSWSRAAHRLGRGRSRSTWRRKSIARLRDIGGDFAAAGSGLLLMARTPLRTR